MVVAYMSLKQRPMVSCSEAVDAWLWLLHKVGLSLLVVLLAERVGQKYPFYTLGYHRVLRSGNRFCPF